MIRYLKDNPVPAFDPDTIEILSGALDIAWSPRRERHRHDLPLRAHPCADAFPSQCIDQRPARNLAQHGRQSAGAIML